MPKKILACILAAFFIAPLFSCRKNGAEANASLIESAPGSEENLPENPSDSDSDGDFFYYDSSSETSEDNPDPEIPVPPDDPGEIPEYDPPLEPDDPGEIPEYDPPLEPDDPESDDFNPDKFAFAASHGGFEIVSVYDSGYFEKSSYEFDPDLAFFAFSMAVADTGEGGMGNFFRNALFDNARFYEYRSPHSDVAAHSIAHKKLRGGDLIAVSVRGFNYGNEWISNFDLGESGHHKGFLSAAEIVYSNLLSYIELGGYGGDGLKIIVTGYSRGGGVANVLGAIVNDSASISDRENVFVYTFEAPRGVSAERIAEDENIHNVISSEDAVTHVAPARYGFKRAGTDYNVYSASYYSSAAFRKKYLSVTGAPAPVFRSRENFASAAELYASLIVVLTGVPSDKNYVSIHTRSEYYANTQAHNGTPALGEAVSLIMNMSSRQREAFTEKLLGVFNTGIISLFLSLENDENALYKKVRPALDNASVKYNSFNLYRYCGQLQQVMKTYLKTGGIGGVRLMIDVYNNVEYVAAMHYPETVYILMRKSFSAS
ncbi:MAG: hypothetical protein J6Z34_06260 [Clostridia bacterium]|nr:hypothetical protein [Clostridia bacterium]